MNAAYVRASQTVTAIMREVYSKFAIDLYNNTRYSNGREST